MEIITDKKSLAEDDEEADQLLARKYLKPQEEEAKVEGDDVIMIDT
jgi:predicted sulfurtransferase